MNALLKREIKGQDTGNLDRHPRQQGRFELPLPGSLNSRFAQQRMPADHRSRGHISVLVNFNCDLNSARGTRRFGNRRILRLHFPDRISLKHTA